METCPPLARGNLLPNLPAPSPVSDLRIITQDCHKLSRFSLQTIFITLVNSNHQKCIHSLSINTLNLLTLV